MGALALAAGAHNKKLVHFLLEIGADPAGHKEAEKSPLLYAALCGQDEHVRVLVDALQQRLDDQPEILLEALTRLSRDDAKTALDYAREFCRSNTADIIAQAIHETHEAVGTFVHSLKNGTLNELIYPPAVGSSLFHRAVKAQMTSTALDRLVTLGGKPTAALLMEGNPSTLALIAQQEMLSALFTPHNCTQNVRVMCDAWAQLSENQRQQMDGQGERPSYRAIIGTSNIASNKGLKGGGGR